MSTDDASPEPPRTFIWAAEPETPDWSVRAATGRHWEEWVALIDAGPGRAAGHPAIAAWVHETAPEISGWWAQGVTVGYERITGLRLPGQMPDGTFTVSRTRLLDVDRDALRARFLDDAERAALFPGFALALRSKPASKSLRFGLTEHSEPAGTPDAAAAANPTDAAVGADRGVLMLTVDPAPGDRVRLTVTHEKLPAFTELDSWKSRWSAWLDTLEAGLEADADR